MSSRINVAQPTISETWRHFTFAGGIVPDMLDVLTEEEQWVAAQQKRAPRPRAQLQALVDDSVLREARRP